MNAAATVSGHLERQGVELTPVQLDECGRFGISIPPIWDRAPVHLFPNATAVLVDRAHPGEQFASNALIIVGKLSRTVEPAPLLRCGFADARALPEWTDAHYDHEPFCGFPSTSISGRYREQSRLIRAFTRYTVVDSIIDQYLVQLTITALADRWDDDEIRGLIDGVRVGKA